MITKKEFEKAVDYCASDPTDCEGCPLCASDKHRMYVQCISCRVHKK